MAGQTRVPDQGALHSELLPAPRSDRAVMGTDASPRDPQPKPPELQRLLPIRSAFPARGGAEKLGRLLRFGHRQFPRHQPCRFSGSQGVGVYSMLKIPDAGEFGGKGDLPNDVKQSDYLNLMK